MNAPTSPNRSRRIVFGVFLVILAILITALVTWQVFGGGSLDNAIKTMTGTPDYLNLLFVNVIVGISVALFVAQLRWNALRVTLTVVAALVLGFFVTAFFNLNAPGRLTRGEFRASVVSTAQPVANDTLELRYGTQRGGEFNKENVRDPLTEAKYRFEGHKGDVVSVLGYAATSRSEVDLQVALLDDNGAQLAFGTTATPEQLKQYTGKLRTAKDAVIEDFTLPSDGVYTVYIRPEPLSFNTVVNETVAATNLAYQAFLLGPIKRVNRWAVWIQDALTLILVGLAIAIAFQARQFSLGAEGQLYLAALVSGAIALATTGWSPLIVVPLALFSAMVAGFLWGLLPGALKAYLGANELVATLMLNTIAIRFYELVLTFQLKPPEAGYIASKVFPEEGQLLPIIQDTQVTGAVFIVIIAVIAVWLLMTRTPLGYEIRMVGANIKFAAYGGINTKRTIMLAMAVSGVLAGLAGAHLVMGIYRQLLINFSVALAFEGVVVALLARNNPLVIPFTGLLYAYLRSGAQFMERDANVSFEVVRIIQAVIILLITAEALITFFQNRRLRQKSDAVKLENPQPQPVEAPAT
ncbi:MAG: ABC transporter permease [Anaerolineae bacterium]|nr:ABC transporter permease [Anaerolineae bacterium]